MGFRRVLVNLMSTVPCRGDLLQFPRVNRWGLATEAGYRYICSCARKMREDRPEIGHDDSTA